MIYVRCETSDDDTFVPQGTRQTATNLSSRIPSSLFVCCWGFGAFLVEKWRNSIPYADGCSVTAPSHNDKEIFAYAGRTF